VKKSVKKLLLFKPKYLVLSIENSAILVVEDNNFILLYERGWIHRGHNKSIHMITFILLIIGGLNWLLFGIFNLDVIQYAGSAVAKIIYILVGASAVYELLTHKNTCKTCSKGTQASAAPQGGESAM